MDTVSVKANSDVERNVLTLTDYILKTMKREGARSS